MAQQKYKWPKKLGEMADYAHALRESRLAAQKAVDVLDEEEKALKKHILDSFPKEQLEGASGKVGKVTRKSKNVPQLDDQEAFYKHLKKTGEFDLLQRRFNEEAVNLRWDAGKTIPGVTAFNVISLVIGKK